MEGEFRKIPNFSKYEINCDGVVRVIKTKRVIECLKRPFLRKTAYSLRNDGKQYKARVQDLLEDTFSYYELFSGLNEDNNDE